MVAKFRALNDSDCKDIGPVLQSANSIDAYDILNTNWTGGYAKTLAEKSLSDLHVRSVLNLVAPTFNFVLARSGATLLRKILAVDADMWKKIVDFELVYDVANKKYVSISDVEQREYLYGAEIAEMLISNLDIQSAIIDTLYSVMSDFFSSSKNPRNYINISKTAGGMELVAGYYAYFDDDEVKTALKRGKTLDDFKNGYANTAFYNNDTRLTYLLNMPDSKEPLYGMLNYHIVVMPVGMRPKIKGKEHKLTKLYTKVIKQNYELKISKNSAHPKSVCATYKSLERAVERLQYKNQGTSADIKPDDLSLLERIKTKQGQIRMCNLGKRQDYSGRAVVSSNPYLPIDIVRVPKTMLPKLLEYHILPYLAKNVRCNNTDRVNNNHLSNVYDRLRLTNLNHPDAIDEMLRIIKDEKLLSKIPIIIGRQPTLHKQSLQGFKIEISESQTIEVSPLVCPAFNMDFDGDQGHGQIPLSYEAVTDVLNLVLSTQNLFLPKNGTCTYEPRHGMLYGLYLCTRNSYVLGAKEAKEGYYTLEDVKTAVMSNKVKVDETVLVTSLGHKILAGDAAFLACFPNGLIAERNDKSGKLTVKQVSSKTITEYIDALLITNSSGDLQYPLGTGYASNETVTGCINRLVELGFRVARLHPPNISILCDLKNNTKYDAANEEFYSAMKKADLMYNLGLSTDDAYQMEFNKHLEELNKKKNENIKDVLGEDNGYVLLSESGARGTLSNLSQAFALKGRVKKNSTEVFDAILEDSYVSQLTPLEHSVAAYGGRQGQIDKSLKTGDTGYAMRQMWHATQGASITSFDCGTRRGLEIDKEFLRVFVDSNDSETIDREVKDIFIHTLVGRYLVNSDKIITKEEAVKMAEDNNIKSVYMRSPITCANPCCQKCYGVDWSTHKLVVKGLPVGIIAAQSIGEPGTQLTLKQFQKGGVASKVEMTSAFDKADNYIHIADLAKLSEKGSYSGYDPCAWATGNVIEEGSTDLTKKVVKIEGSKKKITVPKDLVLKTKAVRGEGLSFTHGDMSINEIAEYAGVECAQKYLMFKLYSIYKSEVKIKMVHFEILVSEMLRFMITHTDRKDLLVGQYCSARELYAGSIANTKFIPRLIGVRKLPNASMDALDSIIMESQVAGLSRCCTLGLSDSLTKPINRMILGLTINNGSSNPEFIRDRVIKV